MLLRKKETKKTSFLNSLFLPSKKRVLIFALAAILVLGVFAGSSFAKVDLTQAQKDELKREWKATDAQITEWANKYNDYNTVRQTAIDAITPPGDPTNPYTAASVATGKSASEIAGGGIDTLASMPVIAILHVIAAFCKMLVLFAARVLDVTLNPSLYNFTGSDFITKGWVVVRDICNLFFLLVLLFIAICTILKIDKYHAKKTLLTLIIMALLINFSKPIAIFIFDGSQLLMNFFLSQMNGGNQTASTMYSEASKISQIVYGDQSFSLWGGSGIAIKLLFSVVFLFMYAVALLVMAIFLLVRIVAIMLLIIVSPFAFFAAIIPDFSNMSTKWWKALFEYSYYGPAAAFFLLIGTSLVTALPRFQLPAGAAENILTMDILQYLVVLVFLYASIIMAKQFGGGAGAAITNWGNKTLKGGWLRKGGWPREIAGWGARTTGAADMYKGVKGGIGKQPGWRILTKEGREARSKEQQAKWEGKVAPFSMAAARKQADDRKNDDQNKVDAGVARGSAADLLIASKRGTLSDEQIASAAVIKTISQSKELRKEVLGNLKDKGNTHLAALLRYKTRASEDAPKKDETDWRNASLADFGEKEINDNKKLADMNWEKVMDAQLKDDNNQQVNFKSFLVNRMGTIADTDPRKFQNIISGLDGARLKKVINDDAFKPIIEEAKQTAGGQRNRGRESQTGGYQSGGYGP